MRGDRPVLAMFWLVLAILLTGVAPSNYVNFESSQVHPINLTPSGGRLLAVNTPDAHLEVFVVALDGGLTLEASIPVGLEPVSVVARTDSEAWVVNRLSDTVSIVDLDLQVTVKTLAVGDEPADVAFAGGKAFVAVGGEDAVKVFNLASLGSPPAKVDLFSKSPRALAVSPNGAKVYAVPLHSGNETTAINENVVSGHGSSLMAGKLSQLGLSDIVCDGAPNPYPPLPAGIARNPALTDPSDGIPKVGLILRWNRTTARWEDDAGQDWTRCAWLRLPDHDLFAIDVATLQTTTVDHLGTSLFDVSINPASGKIYVPNTEALNATRFEHPLGVRGHVVDNRLAIVDPSAGNAVTVVDLNGHIDRGSNPATNLVERQASISQPGMMVWKSDGSAGYLTAIGSRKVFRVSASCTLPACIFGPARATPDSVVVGEGPTGVALHEGTGTLYVLDRFTNSIALVDAASMTKSGEIELHDPSSATIRSGRRFLYDAIDTSGHGDAACSSCHISGDRDGLAWDLGNPEGALATYGTPGDNVRFVTVVSGTLQDCTPGTSNCASHAGFDPQKGPMTTQTLRGMIEPLHWRGDRGTLLDFNQAFVGLMGRQDIGPIGGKPAGLSAEDMATLRQFALGIQFPPNPYRKTDDTLPNVPVVVPDHPVTGNPTTGASVFATLPNGDLLPARCVTCHASSTGTAGGKLGGFEPGNPPSDLAALAQGQAVLSAHNDLKIPHLRNLYEKIGPIQGPHSGAPPERKTGFGYRHDGSISDLATFLSLNVFGLNAQQIRDVSAFLLYFPTGTRPAVGKNPTVPAGAPPTGTPAEEDLLTTLLAFGDAADANRHCELTASMTSEDRTRSYRFTGGAWQSDVAAEPPVTTAALRSAATGPVTFLCATIGSGSRLGGDRDQDQTLDGNDCDATDAAAWSVPTEVSNVRLAGAGADVTWNDQAPQTGPEVTYDIVGGSLGALRASGLASASCVVTGVAIPAYPGAIPNPPPGEGFYVLVRAKNTCGSGGFGAGREGLDGLACLGGMTLVPRVSTRRPPAAAPSIPLRRPPRPPGALPPGGPSR